MKGELEACVKLKEIFVSFLLLVVCIVGSSGLEIIKKRGGGELIINEPLLIKNLSFLMLPKVKAIIKVHSGN